MILKLTHIKDYPEQDCRIGVLEDGHGFQLYTLDPLHGVPDGVYALIPYDSPTHGATWCLQNPDLGIYAGANAGYPIPAGATGAHDYIELHVGNFRRDTKDCILVARQWAGGPMINQSVLAMKDLRAHLGPMSSGHQLIISGRND